ncbi:MAG: nuclear transport factor 2 family protein, partial [Pseudomonadota bacterium]
MRIRLILIVTALLLSPAISAAHHSGDKDEAARTALASLLEDFLYKAIYGERAIHARFWHDDLVYTSSRGTRTDKASILANMSEDAPSIEPAQIFSGEQVRISVRGDMAIVAFQLVATPNPKAEVPAENRVLYYNTGTFVYENNEWRAIAWQATRIPE